MIKSAKLVLPGTLNTGLEPCCGVDSRVAVFGGGPTERILYGVLHWGRRGDSGESCGFCFDLGHPPHKIDTHAHTDTDQSENSQDDAGDGSARK